METNAPNQKSLNMYDKFEIGNFVFYKEKEEICRIFDIHRTKDFTFYQLKRLDGSSIDKNRTWYYYPIKPIDIGYLYEIMGKDFDLLSEEAAIMFINEECHGVKLSYVHEIQNAYKMVTGKELIL